MMRCAPDLRSFTSRTPSGSRRSRQIEITSPIAWASVWLAGICFAARAAARSTV